MFDAQSAELLEAAPKVRGLNPAELPQLLTRNYAQLVARRLRGAQREENAEVEWSLERIADVYEVIATVSEKSEIQRSAAFVAGTAQQILAREMQVEHIAELKEIIDRDRLDASMAAALLFFIAGQYADAYEAAGLIDISSENAAVSMLSAHVRDFTRGKLVAIIERGKQKTAKDDQKQPIEVRAFQRLVAALAEGIECLSAYILSEPSLNSRDKCREARELFELVLELSANSGSWSNLEGTLRTSYPGPAHLASLLLAASDGLEHVSLTLIPPPKGSDKDFWRDWLRFRAQENPYVWQNHRKAIDQNFHWVGQSAVLVLPTGAGKTTVATLKIASTLAANKKVVFLAPTHALAEQVKDDLQRLFPADRFGLKVSAEFDSLLIEGSALQDIEVMTPEGCLAMLSYSPESFSDVGLLVFDECHLLSPEQKRLGRALDGMLCLLTFCEAVPTADLLFLSAMLKNAHEFGSWVQELTARKCAVVELLWKPSRQARGVVVYKHSDISLAEAEALKIQRALDREKGKKTAGLRTKAKSAMTAKPYAVWGLRHNWMDAPESRALTALAEEQFPLGSGYSNGRVWATPNANEAATNIVVAAAKTGAKSIVFVNTKAVSVSTATKISTALDLTVSLSEREILLWSALASELGDVKHSVFGDATFGAVPHNAAMLRLERMLAEELFKRPDGARVIVATPTLAQGLNLPANMAVLAGDKRSDEEGQREDLEAHELLNAAARAGRAGHLANGVVLLVPEPLVTFKSSKLNDEPLEAKLKAVLPEDDRCVTITDPIEKILDRIANGEKDDKDVRNTVNRLATLALSEEDSSLMDGLMARSFGAYRARQQHEEEEHLEKVVGLWAEVREAVEGDVEDVVVRLASKTGLPLDLVERLRKRLVESEEELPGTVLGWVQFIFQWLEEDPKSRDHLLAEVQDAVFKSAGVTTKSKVDKATLAALEQGVVNWIQGQPMNVIERSLKGDPDSSKNTKKLCPRARELTSTFIARGLSFIAGVVSRLVVELGIEPEGENSVIKGLAPAVRRGFDSPELLAFANRHPQVLSRVELHLMYASENT